jgi:DMSO/TMAO reductase YedYZ molybdopterin-dependent catalytic subunit
MGPMANGERPVGKPVGRRVVLGMLGLGGAGVVGGSWLAHGIADALDSLSAGTESSLSGLIPGGDYFQLYTVTDGFPAPPPGYRLQVDGLVHRRLSLSVEDLEAMPTTVLVKPFQCVTGWRVPNVHWEGVRLADLLDEAGVAPGAKALLFRSFDGVYTESLTLAQARLPDVIVAHKMLGRPVTRAHGGPLRLYVAPMYGYKSVKWLSRISVVDRVYPGYWEQRGYAVNAWVGRSNDDVGAPIS